MATLGYRAEIDAGQRFIESIEPDEPVALLFHDDADGCCAGAIVYRALRHMGHELVFPVFMSKSETIYSDSVQQRVLAREPVYLIVLDAGSRTRVIVPGLTTMVIDHHKPSGIPPVDVFVTSHGVEPPATAAYVAYQICRPLPHLDGTDWLAAIGTLADLGPDADVQELKDAKDRYGLKALREAAALINSARRAPAHDIAAAFEALIQADSPLDIVEGGVPQTGILQRYRQEVSSEFRRVLRTAPKISGKWAVLKFRSAALVHPLIAVAWTRRLSENYVTAANYGYTEGNVHFSVRSAQGVDLMAELNKIRPQHPEAEFAHGHSQATGGILSTEEFKQFLQDLGFTDEIANTVP